MCLSVVAERPWKYSQTRQCLVVWPRIFRPGGTMARAGNCLPPSARNSALKILPKPARRCRLNAKKTKPNPGGIGLAICIHWQCRTRSRSHAPGPRVVSTRSAWPIPAPGAIPTYLSRSRGVIRHPSRQLNFVPSLLCCSIPAFRPFVICHSFGIRHSSFVIYNKCPSFSRFVFR